MSETRIVGLRTERGWTQERLAEVSGVTVRTVQRLEAGNDVSLDTLSRLAGALEVPLRDLVAERAERDDTGNAGSTDDIDDTGGPAAGDDAAARHFADAARSAWRDIALGVALLVTSPAPVVLLIAGADAGLVPTSVEVAIAIGLGALLAIALVATLHLVRASGRLSPFLPIRQERVRFGARALRWAERLEGVHRRQRTRATAVACAMWVSSPLPLIVVALIEPGRGQGLWIAAATAVLLVVVAAGAFTALRTAWAPYVQAKLAPAVEARATV
ncbi:helix-turn-helix transcriptional regulator [Curtobacterium sp. YC1]|uniref:helix-turn-helix domain-containing protein n=1 Tax=Curtobacterium sp. YC1 TaxID=2795488 RepID=UPI0018E532DC|nr:helix-turn-helix transcriptional regulator [Curtobacterium sp. YC1]QQD75470.1 helix-turn-helix transcriptional regulator [Curtobacterium sp. YC1]